MSVFRHKVLLTSETSLLIVSIIFLQILLLEGELNSSELNILFEAWLDVKSDQKSEAIVNLIQKKAISDYSVLMRSCLSEFNRILKSGRWITVEFHNSQNSIWNSIQEALGQAGFIVADVRTLDKQKGTTKQLTFDSAVKQDLVISAYKPNGNLEDNFRLKAGTEDGAWEFVRYHLGKLPVVILKDGNTVVNSERQAFLSLTAWWPSTSSVV